MIVKQNYPESISRFMRWAEERIEKEVESIKRLEKQMYLVVLFSYYYF